MLRREATDENENLDRWLVSYADFITLLFAFFVVMYSISSVNEGKYRVLTESVTEAFETRELSPLPIQIGEYETEPSTLLKNNDDLDNYPGPLDEETELEDNYANAEEFIEIRGQLEEKLTELIDNDLAQITANKNWLEIDLRSTMLFESGSDQLGSNATPILQTIASTLLQNQQQVSVRGHTDNIPIDTNRFRSNWDLSAARAVAVVQLLQTFQIAPMRMTAEGHGEFQPVASNETAAGRARNRRVTIAISRYKTPSALAAANNSIPSEAAAAESDVESAKRENEEQQEPTYEVVRLPGGGLLIRGKPLPEESTDDDDDQP